jgi:hypothetical protein
MANTQVVPIQAPCQQVTIPKKDTSTTSLLYLFYLYLILTCNRKVMAEATNYGTLSSIRVLHLLLAGICPRVVFHIRVVVPFLLFGPLFCYHHLVQEPCLLRGHHARSFPPFLYPSPPIFKLFFHLYFLHKAERIIQKEHYTTTRPPPPLLSSPLSPPLPLVLASLPPMLGRPTLPHPSSPLSPTHSILPSLCTAPPLLCPLFFIGVVTSPRLPFPSTIWMSIPLLLMTSAQVFLAAGVFVCGWWVLFPLPPFFVFGVRLVLVVAHLLLALSFHLFFCTAFPSTVFHPCFSIRAVVVGALGRVVS